MRSASLPNALGTFSTVTRAAEVAIGMGWAIPARPSFPPAGMTKKIMDNVHDIARRPDQPPIYQAWNSRWLARGTRDDVEVVVVVASDGRIWSGWPRPGSPGVVSNPRRPDEQV